LGAPLSDRRNSFDPEGMSGMLGDGGLKTGMDVGLKVLRTITQAGQRRRVSEENQSQRRAMDATVANPPPIYGSASWAEGQELRQAGLLRGPEAFDHPSSILLGAFVPDGDNTPEGWLHWDGEGHLLSVAPTRSGKSTTQIIPNLLRYRGSAVVLDPKGELYEATSEWRSKNVGPVYRLAPMEPDSHAFNPLDMVKNTSDARALASLMIPPDPHSADYFRKDSVAFLPGLLEYMRLFSPPGENTLGVVREITSLSPDDLVVLGKRMAECGSPVAERAGNMILSKTKDRGLPTLRSTLEADLALWDDDRIIRATSRADFRFTDLKERPTTVYVTVPFGKMGSNAPFLKIILACALEAMLQNTNKPKIPVLFVLDEFLSLGAFPEFLDAIRTHAGAGVRLWFFLQNLSKLSDLYPTSWRGFFDTAVQMFFGTSDIHTGNHISETLGETTIAYRNTTFSLGTSLTKEDFLGRSSTDNLNVSHSVNMTSRKLLTPSEIVQLLGGTRADGTREAIMNLAGVRPIRARLVPYFLGKIAAARVGQLHA
jgi:type IV secretion system protein VirD4